MEAAIITVIGAIIVALLSFHGGRALTKSQKNVVDIDALVKLSAEVQRLNDNLIKVKNQVEKYEDKNRILWQYVYQLIENNHRFDMQSPRPPVELESDPVLIKLLSKKKDS